MGVKAVGQVFVFDVLSKLLLGFLGILLIRLMTSIEYARYVFALSVVTATTQTLVASFNRVYIVGHRRLNLGGSPPSFFGFQLACIAVLMVMFLPFKGIFEGVYWFVFALIAATAASEFTKTVFQQELKFFQFSMVELSRSAMFFMCILVLAYLLGDTITSWQVLLVQSMTMLVVFLIAFRRRYAFREYIVVGEAIQIAKSVAGGTYKYLFAYFILLAFFSQVDIFALKAISNTYTIATYGAAYRYYSLLLISLGSIHNVLLPTIVSSNSREELREFIQKLNRLLIVVAPTILIGAWLSKWIIPWIDKGKYPGSVIVFRILSVSAILSFTFSPYVNILLKLEDFRFLLVLAGFVLLLNICLNVALIPLYNATGAAIATLVSFGFLNGATYLRANWFPGEP